MTDRYKTALQKVQSCTNVHLHGVGSGSTAPRGYQKKNVSRSTTKSDPIPEKDVDISEIKYTDVSTWKAYTKERSNPTHVSDKPFDHAYICFNIRAKTRGN